VEILMKNWNKKKTEKKYSIFSNSRVSASSAHDTATVTCML